MPIFPDRVRVAIATPGQGTITFGAAWSAAMNTPAEEGLQDGDEVVGLLEEGSDYELFEGVIGGSVTTLTRATVRKSKIAGAYGTTKMNLAGNASLRLVGSSEDFNRFLNEDAEADVASSGTTDIGAETSTRVRITGTTTITSFGTRANKLRYLRFASALTLTNGASLVLPGAADKVTEAGDTATAFSDADGVWRVVDYQRASGEPLVAQVRKVNGLAPYENLVVKYVTVATVDIDADAVTVFNAAGHGKRLAGINLTVDIAATGANGRDVTENSGNEQASVWYHLWVIWNGTTVAGFASQSLTPTLPSGYTHMGYVGSARNNGSSNLLAFHQTDNRFQHVVVSAAVLQGTAATYTALDLSTMVPPTMKRVTGIAGIRSSSGTNEVSLRIASEGSGGTATYTESLYRDPAGISADQYSYFECPLSVAQQIAYYVQGTNAAGTIFVNGGWY